MITNKYVKRIRIIPDIADENYKVMHQYNNVINEGDIILPCFTPYYIK